MTSSISGSRMKLPVYLPQVLPLDVRIDLRRCDVRVTEHFLHCGQVGTALEQVRRERVPQRVWRNPLANVCALHVLAQDLPDAHARERQAARIQEDDTLRVPARK